MKSIFSNAIFMAGIVTMGIFMSSGCRKKKDTIAKIYVRNVANVPVAGCRVVLKGESTTNQPASVVLFDTTTTNSAGEAIFNFNDVYQLGQAGVAVLNIEAEYDNMTGQGIIKIEEETTSEETVFLQQ
jgi:hypothetical protein